MQGWGAPTGLQLARTARDWIAKDGAARVLGFDALCGLMLTRKGETLKHVNAVKKQPGLRAVIDEMAADFRALMDFDRRIETADLAVRALRAGHRIVHRYRQLKRAAVAIDYDDMIAETVALLGPEGMPGYVAWKLDSRFEHVLVDEAQDTNPRQWAIIRKLVEAYFEPDADRSRSLFVVGDLKQSIYGFQGTDPRLFEAMAAQLSPNAALAAQISPNAALGARAIERVDLDLSFRSGPAVLDVVNGFLEAATPAALGMQMPAPPHQPHRAQAAGEVVLWPVVRLDEGDDDYASDAESGSESGAENGLADGTEAADREMAHRLAGQIAVWLAPGPGRLWLPAHGRFARPQDILVLLRRRSWLMGALVAELHQARVPVAGVDRLLLTEPLAVLDCLALVRFAVQPEDDLNLACLLVSPFLGWDHEAIRSLGGGRPGLWEALGRAAPADAAAADARAWLGGVLALADRVGPYRFLDTILSGPLAGRKRLVARLGREANDPIDELLAQALAYGQANPPALAGFLQWVEADGSDVKRDADAPSGQVRLMTIHGAKGLEAPVVVLADSAHQRRGRSDGFLTIELDGGNKVPLFHPPAAACPRKIVAEQQRLKALDDEEDLRLLYVGLTRAADHLFVGGAVGTSGARKLGTADDRCWHSLLAPVIEGLPGAERIDSRWGEALRLRRGAWTDPAEPAATLVPAPSRIDLSTVLLTVAPPPGRPARPLTPSGLPDAPPEGPAAEAMRAAARRGSLIHTLFERLPAVPAEARAAVGRSWLDRQGANPEADSIIAEVLAIVGDPALAALFGPDALAEAPIAGLVGGQTIAGVVDRLLVEPGRVLIVDFKTGLAVPADADAAPIAHRRQMAAYASVLSQAFPGRAVEAALLYTAAPKFLLLADKHMAGLLSLD
ncbi:MAG: UvrD-helicase domain-containing protein, partial [Sandaracinobacteroides sp.]